MPWLGRMETPDVTVHSQASPLVSLEPSSVADWASAESTPSLLEPSRELSLVINLLEGLPPPICHVCARRWQPPRKRTVTLPPKGIIRRNSDLWRSRRLICQTRTCRWPIGQRLASQGNCAFCPYLCKVPIQWEHWGTTPVIYLFVLFQGRFVAACYVKPKKGSTDSQHGLRQSEGSWIAMMARSRATARTDTAISKPCVFLPTASRIRPP